MKDLARSVTSAAVAMVLATGIATAIGTSANAATAPNGLIAYSSWNDNLDYDIYTTDPANPSLPPVRLTTDGRYNSNPDWSPDGSKIVYDGWANYPGPRIQVMDADPATDDSTVISEPCGGIECYGDFQPAWSPDGTRVAFVSSRPNADGTDNWSYELYVMDAAGEVGSLPQATRLTTDPLPEYGQGINDSQVTWSPDGQRLAFLSSGRGLNQDSCDLWMMDSRDLDGDGFGDNMQRLTFDESFNCDPFEDVSPQWAPNSGLIAFTSVRSGYFDIWVVNADDPSDLRNVTQTPDDYEDQPSWSPDGTQIIFRSSVSGAYELYSLPVPPPGSGVATTSQRVTGASMASTAPTPTRLTFDGKTKQQADWGPATGQTSTSTLTVSKRGRGRVRSQPAGISCGTDCSEAFVTRTLVKLTARPATGYRFDSWGGACSGTLDTCTVRMNRARSVVARFVKTG